MTDIRIRITCDTPDCDARVVQVHHLGDEPATDDARRVARASLVAVAAALGWFQEDATTHRCPRCVERGATGRGNRQGRRDPLPPCGNQDADDVCAYAGPCLPCGQARARLRLALAGRPS